MPPREQMKQREAAVLDAAMDMLKERTPESYAHAWTLFAELDEQWPDWQLRVPWRSEHVVAVRRTETRVCRIIAHMMAEAGHRTSAMAKGFDRNPATIKNMWLRQGEMDLHRLGEGHWVTGRDENGVWEYWESTPKVPLLEDECETAVRRLAERCVDAWHDHKLDRQATVAFLMKHCGWSAHQAEACLAQQLRGCRAGRMIFPEGVP